jgi:hypothetical protein
MIKELSTYVYDDKHNERGQRMPKDSENHLCDALRYAFEDVKFFHPQKEKQRVVDTENISGKDLNGGWNV